HGMTGAVGGGTGALRGAFAVMRRHATEGTLIDLAVLAPREWQAPMLQLVHCLGRTAAHVFDGILIAQPIGAFDGVVQMPAPVVISHIAERGGDAALRRDRMRAGGKPLGDAGGLEPRLAAADHRTQASAAGANHNYVVIVILDRVGAAVDRRSFLV